MENLQGAKTQDKEGFVVQPEDLEFSYSQGLLCFCSSLCWWTQEEVTVCQKGTWGLEQAGGRAQITVVFKECRGALSPAWARLKMMTGSNWEGLNLTQERW